jgi:transposase-like protein
LSATNAVTRDFKECYLLVLGIRTDGHREILGMQIGDSENSTTWEDMFKWLKGRSLSGAYFVISDDHCGITHDWGIVSRTERCLAGTKYLDRDEFKE